jgi:hypothetical protein
MKLRRLGIDSKLEKFPACIRYAVCPKHVGRDIERFMDFALKDAEDCILAVENQQEIMNSARAVAVTSPRDISLNVLADTDVADTDGWAVLATLDFDDQEYITSIIDEDDEAMALMDFDYSSSYALVSAIESYVIQRAEASSEIDNVFA